VNTATSIKARLRNIAVREQKPYEYIQTHYVIERLLYRLSVSRYSRDFILKGGLLLHSIFHKRARATRDIDLLAKRIENTPEHMNAAILEVCQIPVDDAVSFDPDTIETEIIRGEADYPGVRTKLVGYLDRSRSTLQLDIGFGDVIIPEPEAMIYPSLLAMDETHMLCYSKESIIAEKFQAMLYLAQPNSRMKDFYDVHMLASGFDFDGSVLREAIYQTITRRVTPLYTEPIVFADTFANLPGKEAQWRAFCGRIHHESIAFSGVLSTIRRFLEPIYWSILHEEEFISTWYHNNQLWS